MNIKSNKIVLAVIAVLSVVFAYLYDKWKYNTMWERCQASDMVDSEAYAFINHHSSLDFLIDSVLLTLIFFIIVKVIATIVYLSTLKSKFPCLLVNYNIIRYNRHTFVNKASF